MQNLAQFPVDARLTNFILSYGLIGFNEPELTQVITSPNGLTGFLIRTSKSIDFEISPQDFEGNSIAHQPYYVIGQTTLPIIGQIKGQAKYLVVFFQPLGLYQLFGRDVSSLTNKSVHLSEFLGKEIFEILLQNIISTEDIIIQIDILNIFFLNQLRVYDNSSVINNALNLIFEANGNISVAELSRKCKVNRRMLERQFKIKIGLSPKIYAQIFRFKYMMTYLTQNPNTSWADLSEIVGYYDQSHLIRYFKEYLKISPNNLVTLDTDFINFILRCN
jgi:AraC-like DNA-binding protein